MVVRAHVVVGAMLFGIPWIALDGFVACDVSWAWLLGQIAVG